MKLSDLFQELWRHAGSTGQFPYGEEPDAGVTACFFVSPLNEAGLISTPFFVALTATDIVHARANYAYTEDDAPDSIALDVTTYPLKYVVRVDRHYRSKFHLQGGGFYSGPELRITVHFETNSALPEFKPPDPGRAKVEGDYAGFCKELIRVCGHGSNQ